MVRSYDYEDYWDERYGMDGPKGSGVCSAGAEADEIRDTIFSSVQDLGVKTLLDVGCGAMAFWGGELPVLKKNYMGIDVSREALDIARRTYPGAKFKRMDFTRSFDLELSDAVTCLDVLFHIKPEHYEKVLSSLFEHAGKVVFIKTLRYDGAGYQFDHGFIDDILGWDMEFSSYADYNKRLYCFRKQDGR